MDLHAELVDWLSSRDAYRPAPENVEAIETHISRVFLAGDFAYKLKKPVRFDFLDFSTPAARESACREELRLNRRLAPGIYLDVVPITRQADLSFEIDGRGETVDWLVVMKRMPPEEMLDARIKRLKLAPSDVDRVAQHLVAFYRELKPAAISATKYRERFLEHVRQNRDELLKDQHRLPRNIVQRVHGFQIQLLQFRSEWFDQRVISGCVVDGHGDLRPEHICLTEPVAIFDCIEFNEEFRLLDMADELAFLSMECDLLGAAWVGEQILGKLSQVADDHPPQELIHFYKAYRACVRAKVGALRFDQLKGSAKSQAYDDAMAHLELADRYASSWVRPLVLAVGGLSGTGKSHLGRALADTFSTEMIRTDVVRREILDEPGAPQAIDQGRYSPESRERVYGEMFHRGAELHRERISVVFDATFSKRSQVVAAREVAAHPQALFLAIECQCPPEVAHQRIAGRLAKGDDVSQARGDIYERQRATWEVWPPEIPQIPVDTTLPVEEQVRQVTARIKRLMNG
jgi:aminoglycoside phosphotransferase family enzyme/predicted kinase